MWPFPRTLVKWREPKAFVEAIYESEERHLRPWIRPGLVGLCVLGAIALSYIRRLDPSKTPAPFPAALVLGLFLGVFVVYVVPAINRRCPSEVKIFTNCICRMRGNEYLRRAKSEIESYSWVADKGFFTLVVNAKGQRPALYGVPDADTKATVEAAFASLGMGRAEEAEGEADTDAPSA